MPQRTLLDVLIGYIKWLALLVVSAVVVWIPQTLILLLGATIWWAASTAADHALRHPHTGSSVSQLACRFQWFTKLNQLYAGPSRSSGGRTAHSWHCRILRGCSTTLSTSMASGGVHRWWSSVEMPARTCTPPSAARKELQTATRKSLRSCVGKCCCVPRRLHCVTAGSRDKPLMLFIHGFPELWYSWRHQLAEFQGDHHVAAFDMRGYGDSDKPQVTLLDRTARRTLSCHVRRCPRTPAWHHGG